MFGQANIFGTKPLRVTNIDYRRFYDMGMSYGVSKQCDELTSIPTKKLERVRTKMAAAVGNDPVSLSWLLRAWRDGFCVKCIGRCEY